MWELVKPRIWRRESNLCKQVQGATACRPRVDVFMGKNGLDQMATDRVQRVQAGQWILKDHPDAGAPQAPIPFGGKVVDPITLKENASPRDSPWRLQQSDNCHSRQRFSGTGLPDDAENLTALDDKRYVIDWNEYAAPRRKFDPQMLDF